MTAAGKEKVLVSTHDLPRAGAVRDGFARAGYATELVTPSEQLEKDERTMLFVLTGMERSATGELVRQAREVLHVPIVGIASADLPPSRRPGFDEVFGASASVEDIVLVGRRLIERFIVHGARYPWNELLDKTTGEPLRPEYFVDQFIGAFATGT